MGLTLEDIDRWDSAALDAVAVAAAERGAATRSAADQLGAVMTDTRWAGHAADAVQQDIWTTRLAMYRHADDCESVGRGVSRSVPGVCDVTQRWRALQDLAASWDIGIDMVVGSVNWVEPPLMSARDKATLEMIAKAVAAGIHHLIQLADRVDADLAAVLNGTDFASDGRDLGFELDPRSPAAERAAERRANQIAAFRGIFGRAPVSAADWDSAAALDPHSYEWKNGGVPPNIVVGHIKPVPGQGVVRTNLFIPGERASALLYDNLGDARGFDPTAGPEQSRVTFYVDYENGIVVGRQNPSVEPGVRATTGTPDVKVSQNRNGSVLIAYRAADPLTPGGEVPAKFLPWNVNGRLVIKPTDAGPIAGGVISDFPAIEVYNDRNGATTTIDTIMPLNIGPNGPLLGLPLSQQLRPELMGEFPAGAYVPAPIAPLAPFTTLVRPYPWVELGPVDRHVRVPVGQ